MKLVSSEALVPCVQLTAGATFIGHKNLEHLSGGSVLCQRALLVRVVLVRLRGKHIEVQKAQTADVINSS